jgi:hypothetical protein
MKTNSIYKQIKIGHHTLTFNTKERYEEFKLRMSYPLINS